jgi:hypothetical protein
MNLIGLIEPMVSIRGLLVGFGTIIVFFVVGMLILNVNLWFSRGKSPIEDVKRVEHPSIYPERYYYNGCHVLPFANHLFENLNGVYSNYDRVATEFDAGFLDNPMVNHFSPDVSTSLTVATMETNSFTVLETIQRVHPHLLYASIFLHICLYNSTQTPTIDTLLRISHAHSTMDKNFF